MGAYGIDAVTVFPVVDGDVLPEAPWQALAAGTGRDIDLLVGHTRDEYRLFNTQLGIEMTDEQVNTTLGWLAPGPDDIGGVLAPRRSTTSRPITSNSRPIASTSVSLKCA
ncbi:carboxylesterase family protein [Nocardia amamiensis]|uniref:carboxylesterase family protein n=1 Tax=Nocardia amamiensis TaxID=404578 RepID=UPI0008317E26|nr:carboxylesterase family protein [Nocardia amamiensis]